MIFHDRADAGRQLARVLLERFPELPAEDPIVLAIPRGGVVVGAEVAREIGAPLDVFIARKLGAPGHEELGIGAVAPGGGRVLDDTTIRLLGVPDEYIEAVTRRELAEIDRRLTAFRGDRASPVLADRTVILVDDGLATGVTARAALRALRAEGASRLIFAVPVCSPEGRDLVAADADEVLCLAAPDHFQGVGIWYTDFSQTSDEEVKSLLGAHRDD